MKDVQVINDLIQKYTAKSDEFNKNLEFYFKQIQGERDPKKQDAIYFDKFIPDSIKSIIVLDKLNLLIWLTTPEGKDLPIEAEEISELKSLTQLYGDMSKEAVNKMWESLNNVLQTIKNRLITCQQIMDRLNEFKKNN